jgi:negative regulator of flagellin synthesis FlgM
MANTITSIGGPSSSNEVDLLETTRASQQSVQGTQSSTAEISLQASDATNLSSLGNLIATAAKRASGQSSMRSDLVASLKAQIAAGTYNPDPNEVAARVAAAIGS